MVWWAGPDKPVQMISSPANLPLQTPRYYCEIWSDLAVPSWNFDEHWSVWLHTILQAMVLFHLYTYCSYVSSIWHQKLPSWTVHMSVSFDPRKCPILSLTTLSVHVAKNLIWRSSRHQQQLYIRFYWLHCVNIIRQYSVPRIFFSILIQNIWFQC